MSYKNSAPTLLTPGMTEVARPIQLANRIKFGSRSFGSIEHERVHKFHLKQSRSSCRQTWKNTILHNQINVTQALIDVDT